MEDANPPRIIVQRAGGELRYFSREEFGQWLAQGMFSPTDLCREEGRQEPWMPIEAYARRREAAAAREKFSAASAASSTVSFAPAEPSSLPFPKPPTRLPALNVGILWLLLAILVLAGLAAGWAVWESLALRQAEEEAARLRAELKARATLQTQETTPGDVAPPGVLRGRVILRNAQGRRIALPAIKVKLYRGEELQRHLQQHIPAILASGASDPLHQLLSQLPDPILSSLSDANGVFEFRGLAKEDYILHSSILDSASGKLRTWFLSVDGGDALNTPIYLTESNAMVVLEPLLIIQPAR